MEMCFRCSRTEEEVRLLDVIYKNELVKACERCAVTEDIPIIRRPTTSQLRDSEKNYSVYQRMKKLAGLEKKEEKHETIIEQFKKLEEHPELEIPEEKKPFNLVDNFHWQIARARRNKGLSQRQLGWALGESEAAIKMIEKGELPEDSELLIKKLEQFLQVKIRKRTEQEIEEEKLKARRVFAPRVEKEQAIDREAEKEKDEIEIEELIEEKGREAASLSSEDELELVSSIASGKVAGSYINEIDGPSPSRILNFKPDIVKNLTIADLKRMKEEREKAENLAKTEEEKRKINIMEKVGDEMKDVALGKEKVVLKREQKKDMAKEKVPTIYELMERKREKMKEEKMLGDEIELEE